MELVFFVLLDAGVELLVEDFELVELEFEVFHPFVFLLEELNFFVFEFDDLLYVGDLIWVD